MVRWVHDDGFLSATWMYLVAKPQYHLSWPFSFPSKSKISSVKSNTEKVTKNSIKHNLFKYRLQYTTLETILHYTIFKSQGQIHPILYEARYP